MRYIIGVIGIMVVAILAILLIGSRSPSRTTTAEKAGAKETVKVTDFSNRDQSEAKFTLQGKLVGENERRAIRIVISDDERRIEILRGYEETVERSQTYPNSPAAFDTFLQALQLAGFSKARKVAVEDERGVCPMGNRYLYDLTDGSDHPVKTWSTSCSVTQGTFAGNSSLIRQLFQKQIPDYNQQIKGVQLF